MARYRHVITVYLGKESESLYRNLRGLGLFALSVSCQCPVTCLKKTDKITVSQWRILYASSEPTCRIDFRIEHRAIRSFLKPFQPNAPIQDYPWWNLRIATTSMCISPLSAVVIASIRLSIKAKYTTMVSECGI